MSETNDVMANDAPNGAPVSSLVPEEKLSLRNLIMFSLGTVGRDFVYMLFSTYLLSFILFTKSVTDAEFAMVSVIIICARIFDALNDPIMGGLVERTRTKWGKFKPWQLSGAILTVGVVIAIFAAPIDGKAFIGFLAAMYFTFSITFTMNDISYWGMMPSLTSNEHDRGKLMATAQIGGGIGSGLATILVPALTVGAFAIQGSAIIGYKVIAIIAGLLMLAFQMFTLFGVKEKPLPPIRPNAEKLTVKKMFKTLAKNDQLLWVTLALLLFCIGSNVVGGGLSMLYIYFEFGYDGVLLTVFGVFFAVTSTLFTILYPVLSKKFGRDKLVTATFIAFISGYLLMLISGLAIPNDIMKFTVLSWNLNLKFLMLMIANGIVGFGGGLYMIMVISIANTVEYNEWKTGSRDEGLIFSLRPFTAKMGSALTQGLVMVVYIATGVLAVTNTISGYENDAAKGIIDAAEKTDLINGVLNGVAANKNVALLICMCLIPIVFMIGTYTIYKKKYILTESFHAKIVEEIRERKLAAAMAEGADGDMALVAEGAVPHGESAVDTELTFGVFVGNVEADDASGAALSQDGGADETK